MNSSEKIAVFAIGATLVMSLIYFLILEKLGKSELNTNPSLPVRKYLFRKISGFALLGVLPCLGAWWFFGFHPADAGLNRGDIAGIWPWTLPVCSILVLANYFNGRNPEIQGKYPELRIRDWGFTGLVIESSGWVLYLAGYEFLFRGLLFFSCHEAFGLWPAVAINLGLYSALHLPKGLNESLAAIPFGALLCYFTLESGSILPAVFIHAIQAISCEMFSIYHHPEMTFIINKTSKP